MALLVSWSWGTLMYVVHWPSWPTLFWKILATLSFLWIVALFACLQVKSWSLYSFPSAEGLFLVRQNNPLDPQLSCMKLFPDASGVCTLGGAFGNKVDFMVMWI